MKHRRVLRRESQRPILQHRVRLAGDLPLPATTQGLDVHPRHVDRAGAADPAVSIEVDRAAAVSRARVARVLHVAVPALGGPRVVVPVATRDAIPVQVLRETLRELRGRPLGCQGIGGVIRAWCAVRKLAVAAGIAAVEARRVNALRRALVPPAHPAQLRAAVGDRLAQTIGQDDQRDVILNGAIALAVPPLGRQDPRVSEGPLSEVRLPKGPLKPISTGTHDGARHAAARPSEHAVSRREQMPGTDQGTGTSVGEVRDLAPRVHLVTHVGITDEAAAVVVAAPAQRHEGLRRRGHRPRGRGAAPTRACTIDNVLQRRLSVALLVRRCPGLRRLAEDRIRVR